MVVQGRFSKCFERLDKNIKRLAYRREPFRSIHFAPSGIYPTLSSRSKETPPPSPSENARHSNANLTSEIMQAMTEHFSENPLDGLISEDIFNVLDDHNLLSEKGVRDYQIRKAFRVMRSQNVPAYDAIEMLRDEYPYLQFDTIRKIVYKLNGNRR